MNYQLKANQQVYFMELEMAAIHAASNQSQADEAETRLQRLREESEALLSAWMVRRGELAGMLDKASKEKAAIMSIRADWSPIASKVSIEEAFKVCKISREEYDRRFRLGMMAAEQERKIADLLDDIVDAIDYLQEWLHPEQSTDDTDIDLPFASLWGDVAEDSGVTPSTPEAYAWKLVNDIIDGNLDCMVQSWVDFQNSPATMYDSRSEQGRAAYYDLLFEFGEDEFEDNPIGAEHLDQAVQADEFGEYAEYIENVMKDETQTFSVHQIMEVV